LSKTIKNSFSALKLFDFFKSKPNTLGLALGGGAARGISHLGVLCALEEYKIPISVISGVSSGGIIGGLYAAGVPLKTLRDRLPSLNWRAFTSFQLSKRGMVSSKAIESLVTSLVGDIRVQDCRIPFISVATNICTGQAHFFSDSEDSLAKVIRASASFPGVYSPVKIGDDYYIDGGVFHNVPVQPLVERGVSAIVGVDVIPSVSLNSLPSNIPLMVDRGLDLMLRHQTCQSAFVPDVMLTPCHNVAISSFDIKQYHQLIDLGYESVVNKVNDIRSFIRS
jgi:NTE family protein